MIAAEYASPMPASDFSSSCDAELISSSLLAAGLLDAGLLAGCFPLEPFGAWYGAPTSVNAASRRSIHLVIFIGCSSQGILLWRKSKPWPHFVRPEQW